MKTRNDILRRNPRAFTVVSALLGIAISALVLVPIFGLIPRVFFVDGEWQGEAFSETWTRSGILPMLAHTLLLAGAGTLLAVVIGSTFAWLAERTDAGMGWVTRALPIIPMMVPPLAGTIGWVLLLTPGPGMINTILRRAGDLFGFEMGTSGPINIFSWYGLLFVYTIYLVPHVFLTVSAGLRNLDPSLEEASRVSGANPLGTLIRVTLPAVLPSVGAGALLALVIGVSMFATPFILGTPAGIDVLAVSIVRLTSFRYPAELDVAVVLGIVMVVIVGGAWLLQRWMMSRQRHATIGGKGGRVAIVRLGRWRKGGARLLMVGYLLASSAIPFLALLVVSLQPFWGAAIRLDSLSFGNYRSVLFESGLLSNGFRNSVGLGAVGATVAMVSAALIVYYIRFNPRNPVARLADGVTKLPAVLSHVVVGMAMIAVFAGPPFNLAGTLLILLLGYYVLYLPQATITAGDALGQIDVSLIEASQSSGAAPGRTFGRVVLPLMRPGLVAGWIFVFVLMVGEVTASVMLASSRTPVVGFVMIDMFNNGTYPALAAIGTVVSLLTSSVVLLVMFWPWDRASRNGSRVARAAGARRPRESTASIESAR